MAVSRQRSVSERRFRVVVVPARYELGQQRGGPCVLAEYALEEKYTAMLVSRRASSDVALMVG